MNLILTKYLNLVKEKCTNYLPNSPSQIEPSKLNRMIKQYQQNLINFGQNTADKLLEGVLFSAIENLNDRDTKQELNITNKDSNQGQNKQIIIWEYVNALDFTKAEIQQNAVVAIKKEREKENDQKINTEYKTAINIFFKTSLPNRVKDISTKRQQEFIIKFIVNEYQLGDSFYLQQQMKYDQIAFLKQYQNLIKSLKKQLTTIQQEFQKKEKECLPLLLIIQNKITNLKIIYIQYEKQKKQFLSFRYSISAFELFKLIHENKLLTQVTLKGIQIQFFEQFLQMLNIIKQKDKIVQQYQINHFSWLKQFNPSNFLKLAIEALVEFVIKNNGDIFSKLNNFLFFHNFFDSISDIFIKLTYQNQGQKNCCPDDWQKLWKCLRTIKRIKIEIQGQFSEITNQKILFFRSVLLGGLTSFTEINQLSFINIRFEFDININHYLAIEHILATIFENNKITHFQLYICQNFPLLPQATNIQSIQIQSVSFRKKLKFMERLTENNKSLKSIKCYHRFQQLQQLRITDSLFSQLQYLSTNYQNVISLDDINPHSPSSLKQLLIKKSGRQQINGFTPILPVLFPKLAYLLYLFLWNIQIGHQLICTIPSPYLQQLQIVSNNTMTNTGLKEIDLKWPYLKYLSICSAKNVTYDCWKVCKFKGLIQICINKGMFKYHQEVLNQLKFRGIKINFF